MSRIESTKSDCGSCIGGYVHNHMTGTSSLAGGRRSIQRCDECGKYKDDLSAARAHRKARARKACPVCQAVTTLVEETIDQMEDQAGEQAEAVQSRSEDQ